MMGTSSQGVTLQRVEMPGYKIPFRCSLAKWGDFMSESRGGVSLCSLDRRI